LSSRWNAATSGPRIIGDSSRKVRGLRTGFGAGPGVGGCGSGRHYGGGRWLRAACSQVSHARARARTSAA
jgi:hypothetical protein